MLDCLKNLPIRKGDVVKVMTNKIGLQIGTKCTVKYVDNLTAIATIEYKYGSYRVHIRDVDLFDRHYEQLKLF